MTNKEKISERNRLFRERVKLEKAVKRANATKMTPERERELIDEYIATHDIVKDHKPFHYGYSGLKLKGMREV